MFSAILFLCHFNGNFRAFGKRNFLQWKKSLFLQMKAFPLYYTSDN